MAQTRALEKLMERTRAIRMGYPKVLETAWRMEMPMSMALRMEQRTGSQMVGQKDWPKVTPKARPTDWPKAAPRALMMGRQTTTACRLAPCSATAWNLEQSSVHLRVHSKGFGRGEY